MEQMKQVFEDRITKAVISNPKHTSVPFRRINIKLMQDSEGEYYQLEKFTDKQAFHENCKPEDITDAASWIMQLGYRQLDAWSETRSYCIKVSKSGKATLITKPLSGEVKAASVPFTHNREKHYILRESMDIPPLVDLGVFTKEGKVVSAMYDKYKQINRFTELVDDVIRQLNQKELHILDFGCGKSYLTFILYYYLTQIRKIDAHITGLDLKADVIDNCNRLAEKYGYQNLKFQVGDINGFTCEQKPDMVIALHACDTATDYALFNAVSWDAKIIFSVPCCQHELNNQIEPSRLKLLTRYGLVKERFSALSTDAIRGGLLEACGYGVQLVEFVDFAHSPKNLLIRAIKKNVPQQKKKEALADVEILMREFSYRPTLYPLLYQKLAQLNPIWEPIQK